MGNRDLQTRKQAAMARGLANLFPVFVDHAKNAEIWDVEGRRYIDFATGISVLNTGHLHPRVTAAVTAQLERFSHTCLMVTPYESAVELAEKLNTVLPGSAPKKTLLVTTGVEAVENAVKIARAHTGRPGIIAFGGAFHGRTLMGLALTGMATPYKTGFGPFPTDVYHAPYPVDYHGVSTTDALAAVRRIVTAEAEPAQIAALIVEPVQGEGGFYIAPAAFLQGLRELCDEFGIVLIVDEIQTGFARTGKMFAIEHTGIEPDIVTTAKSLAAGFPLAAVTGKAAIMDAAAPGGLGGTYAGSPVGCAAALATLEIIAEERLCERAEAIGKQIQARLQELAARHAAIGDVRQLGAMVAMELVRDGNPDLPDAELTAAIVRSAAARGLILLSCGYRKNVVRFLPALTAPDEIIMEGMDTLAAAMAEVCGN